MNSILFRRGAALALLLLMLAALTAPAALAAEPDGESPVTAVAESAPAETDVMNEDYTPLATLVADFLGENAAGLLSGATFALTLILSLVCRKRLVPPLLEALSSLLGKSRDLSDAIRAGQAEEREGLTRLFGEAEELLAEVKAAATRAEEATAAIRRGESGREETALILREQTNLLYELLMSANLPQYQKDRIGAAHAAAEAALAELSHG